MGALNRLSGENLALIGACALLNACQPGGGADVPGDASDGRPFSQIGPEEAVYFSGTEPFWGGESSGDTLVYTAPDKIDGRRIAIKRFAGRGGLSFSGRLEGASFDMTITPGECSDGMSDRTYPMAATLKIGDDTRMGCAWTDAAGFTGPQNP